MSPPIGYCRLNKLLKSNEKKYVNMLRNYCCINYVNKTFKRGAFFFLGFDSYMYILFACFICRKGTYSMSFSCFFYPSTC